MAFHPRQNSRLECQVRSLYFTLHFLTFTVAHFALHLQPPGAPNCFSSLQLAYHTEKLKLAFGAIALATGERPTHGEGIGATGLVTIVTKPQFPACEFFTPGRSYPVRLRHSKLHPGDDAEASFFGASLKFADSDNESALDLILNTGETAALWKGDVIYESLTSAWTKNFKEFILRSPVQWVVSLSSLFLFFTRRW